MTDDDFLFNFEFELMEDTELRQRADILGIRADWDAALREQRLDDAEQVLLRYEEWLNDLARGIRGQRILALQAGDTAAAEAHDRAFRDAWPDIASERAKVDLALGELFVSRTWIGTLQGPRPRSMDELRGMANVLRRASSENIASGEHKVADFEPRELHWLHLVSRSGPTAGPTADAAAPANALERLADLTAGLPVFEARLDHLEDQLRAGKADSLAGMLVVQRELWDLHDDLRYHLGRCADDIKAMLEDPAGPDDVLIDIADASNHAGKLKDLADRFIRLVGEEDAGRRAAALTAARRQAEEEYAKDGRRTDQARRLMADSRRRAERDRRQG